MLKILDYSTETYTFHCGNALDAYPSWPSPNAIISDGAYGVRGFIGDTTGIEGLTEWYRPHLKAWDLFANPSTVLWFWNTEIGWATVHPLIESYGWKYVETVVWDKGLSHIAGNVNGKTIRQYPVVTEICVLYQRKLSFNTAAGSMNPQQWLRYEWLRSGLPLSQSNEACGLKNAATRKYLTRDWLWYWPPGEMVEKMADYLNSRGREDEKPYLSLDGKKSVRATQWDRMRYKWNHVHGLTNVWSENQLNGLERLKGGGIKSAPRSNSSSQYSAIHLNQKPLDFMRRMITSTTDAGDIVWEPFGGLASASVASVELNRYACAAEINENFQTHALKRLQESEKRSADEELA